MGAGACGWALNDYFNELSMKTRFVAFAFLITIATFACAESPIDFNRDIRPLLSNNCFQCHGPDANHREADLRLDVEAEAKASAITPGDAESEVVVRIFSDDDETVMPPAESGKKLSQEEKALLADWIKQGAKWQQHWAYEPPRQHDVVPKTNESSPWIDHFIRKRLVDADKSLLPSFPADKVTLVRRLYFDLIGLPPTPEQVRAFVENKKRNAYESLVDELLASPHFGERMAIYWLDLVRFADTVGYHGDQDQNISPYRDYVIDAFNRNLPFDQFTREQLAGDLLDDPTIDQKVATGYNRMLQTSHEGGVQPKEYLSIYQADRVRNVSAVWLGGTLGCAQCHDHKYDPYTARDFYSMAAFFADIDEEQHFKKGTNSLPTARPPEIDVLNRRERERLAAVTEELDGLAKDGCENDETERIAKLEKEKKSLRTRRRRTMITVALEKPRTVRILPRGDWLDDTGEVVEPAVPQFLGELSVYDRRPNRLDLANWFVNEKQGAGLLTARVMANRFWYLLFGVGLSNSLDDFGGQGEPPVHPELLDNLAIEFVANGWNVKRLLKSIVMSDTYQQSSKVSKASLARDPNNQFFARQSRFRLPAEMVRDAALSAGGLLVNEFGGASVKPYQPFGYYRHLNFPQRRYSHHGDERQWRRGVYVHWQRQFLHPMLKAFDAPTREECTAKRPKSNTPLAALVLLNDPTFVEAARGLAARLLERPSQTDSQRLQAAFEIVLSRPANKNEQATLLKLLSVSQAEYEKDLESAKALLEIGESEQQVDQPAELAAWTIVSRAILNLGEANTRQ